MSTAAQTSRTAWSLERRLPVLISALLALALGTFGAAAYRETRAGAEALAVERLGRLARELARTSAASGAPRTAALAALAADPLVRRAVLATDAGAGDPVLRVRLDAATPATDSMFRGFQLWGVDSERRLGTGPALTPREAAVLGEAVAAAARTDSVRRSALFASGDRVHVWTVVPVREGGRRVGFLAEQRRLANNPRVIPTLRGLTGDDDVSIAFTSQGSAEWASVLGAPIAPLVSFPEGAPDDSVVPARGPGGGAYYAVRASVPGTPWYVVLARSRAQVLQRPREFLERLLVAGAFVLALGAALAWLVSRHVTRPLSAITGAAEAIAAGEYGRRVGAAGGGAELERLATTFDAMAERVGDAHDELADRNVALERANAAKSQFLAMMSHELRTPLNAIGGYAQLVELGVRGPVTPAQVEDLARIRRNKDHLLAIIDDLLTFARGDAGRISVSLSAVRVADALAHVHEMLAPQYDAKGIALEVAEPPAGLRVLADPDRLQQILLNLLTNALRFTDAGGRVTVRADAEGDVVRLAVSDTGIGIPADRLEAVFQPFVQVDAGLTRKVGGTGLGLAIARDLACAMGGSIAVRSVEGEGSTFTVELPVSSE